MTKSFCNQEKCTTMKERLEQHQLEHHKNCKSSNVQIFDGMLLDGSSQTEPGCTALKGILRQRVSSGPLPGRPVSASPTSSTSLNLRRSSNDAHCQVSTTLKEVGTIHSNKSDDLNYKKRAINIPLRRTETWDIVAPRRSYKEALKIEIMKWLQEVPIYPNFEASIKSLRENMVNGLMEKIYNLSIDMDSKKYEENIKNNITIFLNGLPMWYPGAQRDQVLFLERLTENLFDKIKGFNIELQKVSENSNNNGRNLEEVLHYSSNNKIGNRVSINENYHLMDAVIYDWLLNIRDFDKYSECKRTIDRHKMKHLFINKLTPLLKEGTMTCDNKLILKSKILELLHDLSTSGNYFHNEKSLCNKHAEDLTERLLSIRFNGVCCRHPNINDIVNQQYSSKSCILKPVVFNDYFKRIVTAKARNILINNKMDSFEDVEDEISQVFVDNLNSVRLDSDLYTKDKICNLLRGHYNISKPRASNIALFLVENIRCVTKEFYNSIYSTKHIGTPCRSESVLVLSEHEIYNYPVTSTPKQKPKDKKEISKLNNEEITYMSKVGELIRSWINTLPEKFDDPQDKNFKDTIINDLAGDIVDEVKSEQFAPHMNTEKEEMIRFLVFKWLFKFDVFEDINDSKPHIDDFVKCLREIPVPVLTKPQHGNRQTMDNIKHIQGKLARQEYFVPKGIDILEDEISIWMNEQPSDIYINGNRDGRNKIIRNLAKKIQVQLKNKRPEKEIRQEVFEWLKYIVVPEKKRNIDIMADQLKERVIKLPQDTTLKADLDKKLKQNTEIVQPIMTNEISDNAEVMENVNVDKTLIQLIDKYLEHNSILDDTMAKAAFIELLKSEFRKLSLPRRKELYENFKQPKLYKEYSFQRLDKELQLIKIISDWLKNIPIDFSYNLPGNKQRIEFVNNLAKNICDVEIGRMGSPAAMDYNMYLSSIVKQSMVQLPILPNHVNNIMFMIDQLIGKVVKIRPPTDCCQSSQNQSLIEDTIKEQNLDEFIEQYIRINSKEFADDQVKLDAWISRVLKEVMKIIQNSAKSKTLFKTELYNKLNKVNISEDNIIDEFSKELSYVKEISEWLNNLPLQPITNLRAKGKRIQMISELAKMISEMNKNKTNNGDNKDLEDYITKWVAELPINRGKELSMPTVIQQLMNRIERVDNNIQPMIDLSEKIERDSTPTKKPLKSKAKIKNPKRSIVTPGLKVQNPGIFIVESIEKWCANLPINSEDSNTIEIMRNNIAKQLFQSVGNLNIDPRFYSDDLLYEVVLSDEIDTVLENLPRNPELQKNWDKLKESLIQSIMDAKAIVREKFGGENYKQQLENTVEASIPIPIQNKQCNDPGFELYKSHLINMFILENFDHGNDAEKLKYERRIKEQIDKYFLEAQKRNATPLSRDQLYNELYSALFKVPIPNELSVIDEVEAIKTRYEIDYWFENLSIEGATCVSELLERDKILSTMAKRIHEIENNEPAPDEKIQKEIRKWLTRLPIIPEEYGRTDKYIEQLQTILKLSKGDRKCIRNSKSFIKKSPKKAKEQNKCKTKRILGTSQIAGPSSAGKMWSSPKSSPQRPCCQRTLSPQKKPADLILETVENWCANLPLYAKSINENENLSYIKDNLVTKIIILISELNADPQVFDDDILFDNLFEIELEKLLVKLPICCEFQKSKETRKYQLMVAIKSVKPLIIAYKARHEYKEELKRTVSTLLGKTKKLTNDKRTEFNDIQEDIVDNFLQYHYNRDDDDGKQLYKSKIYDAVLKYFSEIANKKERDDAVDPVIRQNQLLCELAKIPIPSEGAIRDEIQETNMKNEVKEFLNESLPKGKGKLNQRKEITSSLAKRLNDLENSGHNCSSDKTMKEEIKRSLKKLDTEISEKRIEAFVSNLKDNEVNRKAPPVRKIANIGGTLDMSQMLREHGYAGYNSRSRTSDDKEYLSMLSSNPPIQMLPYDPVYLPQHSEKWLTLYSTHSDPNAQGISKKEICNSNNITKKQIQPPDNVSQQTGQIYTPTPIIQNSPTRDAIRDQTLNSSHIANLSAVTNRNLMSTSITPQPMAGLYVSSIQNIPLAHQNNSPQGEISVQNTPEYPQSYRSRPLAAMPGFTPPLKRRIARNTPSLETREQEVCKCVSSRRSKRRRNCVTPMCWDDFGPICWGIPYPRPGFFYY